MPNGGIIDVGGGVAQTIGRYFSVISLVPSSMYVAFVYVLIMVHEGNGHSPNWSRAFKSLEQLGVGGIALLALLSIGFGVILHPIQFAIVQFFEGYWGNSRIAQAVRSQRILRYQRLCERLSDEMVRARHTLKQWSRDNTGTAAARVPLHSRFSEAERIRDTFPRALDYVMPTRLGNVLRRAESQAGSQYNLDALQAVPHLLLIAPPGHVDYVNDQRSQLDLAVRMTFISALASFTSVVFLCCYHFWVLIALIPYVLAYLSYRGSIIAASHYGLAFDALINLDRFELYKQLHLKLPAGTLEEREANTRLTELLEYDPDKAISYWHPADGDQS